MGRALVEPIKRREFQPDLNCDVLRVVGYRATCECGKPLRVESSVRLARLALAAHRASGHH